MSNSQTMGHDGPPWDEEEPAVDPDTEEDNYDPQPPAWWYFIDHKHDVRTKAFGDFSTSDGFYWICNEKGDTILCMPVDEVHALRADVFDENYINRDEDKDDAD